MPPENESVPALWEHFPDQFLYQTPIVRYNVNGEFSKKYGKNGIEEFHGFGAISLFVLVNKAHRQGMVD